MSTNSGQTQAGWWLLGALLMTPPVLAADLRSTPEVRDHADQTFQRLHQREQRTASENPNRPQQDHAPAYHAAQFLIGQGQGDQQRETGCQRVSELAARVDIAKQIRVLVKEHATDRVRERTGREAEQDIEVVREEIVQEVSAGGQHRRSPRR